MAILDSLTGKIGELGNNFSFPASSNEGSSHEFTATTTRNIVQQMVKNVPWTRTDDFHVFISNPIVSQTDSLDNNIFEMAIESITLPSMTSSEQDNVIGGERRIGTKIFESFRFSITFRDFGGMSIYRWMQSIWITQQYEYFDEIKSHIKMENNGVILFETSDALITSISELSFGHSTEAVATFTVQFICNKFSNNSVKDFGSQDYMDYFKKG
jgi:hypothetical protein